MSKTLELVERVHREYSTGQAIDVPRERSRRPAAAAHPAGRRSLGERVRYKAYTSSREGVRFLVYAFSAENGRLEGVVEANYLGMMRTGAAGGVAAKWLRPDAKVAGIFGSGWQAEGSSRPCLTCASWSASFFRNAEKVAKFCERMARSSRWTSCLRARPRIA
jgi:ornithine cyclodeaminase